MRNSFLKISVTVAIFVLASLSGRAASMTTLHGHVPGVIARLNLQPKGELPGTNYMTLAIGLPLRNTNDLENLLQQIYDPSSTNYHHFLTPEEFSARFGPTEQDYQKVIQFAHASGYTVTGTHPNRVLLDVRAKVFDVENSLHVKFHTYRHPTESRDFFAPNVEPTVDSSLPIIRISGLENYPSARPALQAHSAGLTTADASNPNQLSVGAPALGTAPGGNFEGNDFRNAYAPGTTLTGAGQNVGLFQLDGFYQSDITTYENQIGLTSNIPQLVVVPVDGGVPTPTSFGNSEVSLDIEMVLSMSPGVGKIYVYEGPNQSSASIYTIFEDVLNRMVNDNSAKQLSCSWYIINGSPDPVSEQIFQQMALQGQTFFSASGDVDAYTGLIPFPCDSPHITLVGGTSLTMNGSGRSYASETVWNWGTEFGDDGVGSSGGTSVSYSIPSWQTNIDMAARGGSNIRRNVPDVALTADHVWVIYGSGSSDWFGGTSCAAPLWAGFTALINQQAASSGHAPVGFINPALYAIAQSSTYTNCFHDILRGNNEWSGSPNLFAATNGYDLCTGLGTPNGTNLINTLATSVNAVTHLSPPPGPYPTNFAALSGANPNGAWNLFFDEDAPGDNGVITNGWILRLTLANPIAPTADNQLLMTASPNSVVVGGDGYYNLTVTNFGPSTSSNVIVADTLPSDVTFVSTSPTKGSIVRTANGLNWVIGTLPSTAGAQLTVTVQPLIASSNLVNSALVSADTSDGNSGDDFAFATLNAAVVTPPSLSATASGGAGNFHFTVTNYLSGNTNVIFATTNLVTGPWVPVYTNIGPSFIFTNRYLTNSSALFFRDELLP